MASQSGIQIYHLCWMGRALYCSGLDSKCVGEQRGTGEQDQEPEGIRSDGGGLGTVEME